MQSFLPKLFISSILVIGTLQSLAQCPTGDVTGNLTVNSGSSPCTISSDMTITGDLTITNSGSLTISSGVTLTVTGTITLKNNSSITATGATVSAATFSDGSNTNSITGGTYNVGTFTMSGGGSTTISGVTVNSTGAITLDDVPSVTNSSFDAATSFNLNSGTGYTFSNVSITSGTAADIQDVSCTSCTLNIGGALTISSGATSFNGSTINTGINNTGTNDADALIMNGGGSLTLSNNTQMNVRGSVTNNEWYIDDSDVVVTGDFDNAGSEILEITNNGSLNVQGDFDNSGGGDVSSDSGSLLDIDGDYDNSGGGSTDVDGGTFVVGGTYSGTTATGDTGGCSSGGGGCCGSSCATLPVSLLDFSGEMLDGGVVLTWSTASELNNDYFTLEVSSDGVEFTSLGIVAGNGTTNEIIEYQYTSSTFSSTASTFYRLSQTDFDGTREVLGIVSVDEGVLQDQLVIYPNPVTTGDLNLAGSFVGLQWEVYTIAGELVIKGDLSESNTVDVSSLTKGVYLLNIKGVNESSQGRFVVR